MLQLHVCVCERCLVSFACCRFVILRCVVVSHLLSSKFKEWDNSGVLLDHSILKALGLVLLRCLGCIVVCVVILMLLLLLLLLFLLLLSSSVVFSCCYVGACGCLLG